MKTNSRIAALLAALIMLSACSGGGTGETTSDPASETQTTPPASTAATEPIPPRDPACSVGEIRIGDRSLTQYAVVLPADPDPAETYAAQELVKYIAQATGKTLETASSAEHSIFVGGRGNGGLGEEGFRICEENGDLIISGDAPRGTLYGVYTFLEDYIGWRWYDWDCESVKTSDFIQIPAGLNDVQKPVYWLRNSFWYNFLQHHELAAKHKSNQGITEDYLGGGVDYTGGLCHTFAYIVPYDLYFAEHPEYFSRVGGTYKGGQYDGQLCLTNPDVLEIAKAYVRNLLKENPDAKLISVTQNDNQTYCKCDNCKKIMEEEGSPAGLMLRFVNAVADDIAADYPGVTIDTFAYQYTRTPPKITRPHENVQIRLCSIECCFSHALDDPDCKNNKKFMEDLEGWSKLTDNLHVWDYTTNFGNYSLPFPNLGVLRENAAIFASHSVTGLFEQGTYNGQGGELGELKAYLLAKLLWDPYMSQEEYQYHINDFLEGYYGPGWQAVRDYIDAMQPGTEGRHCGIFGQNGYYGIELETLEDIKRKWDEAEASASPEQKLRLERSRVSLMLSERAYYTYFGGIENSAKAREIWAAIRAKMTELGIRTSESQP